MAENEQSAEQSAQQVGQQVDQGIAALQAKLSALSQEISGLTSKSVGATIIDRAEDIGLSESWTANMKQLFDEFKQESLTGVRDNRQLVARKAQSEVSHDAEVRQLSIQALQNAVETANMVGKQAVRHGDIAIDRQWNVNETDAFATILASKVAEELKAA